jgi:hypothetical protein
MDMDIVTLIKRKGKQRKKMRGMERESQLGKATTKQQRGPKMAQKKL